MVIKYNFVLDGETFVCKTFDDLETLDNYHDIVYINCQGNKLTVLPTLPNSLVYLICSSNKLSVLPVLPNSLTHLHCGINRLILIPTLPNRLRYLDCEQNLLMFLPKFPDSLTYKCYNYNPVDTYIKDSMTVTSIYTIEKMKYTQVNWSGGIWTAARTPSLNSVERGLIENTTHLWRKILVES